MAKATHMTILFTFRHPSTHATPREKLSKSRVVIATNREGATEDLLSGGEWGLWRLLRSGIGGHDS